MVRLRRRTQVVGLTGDGALTAVTLRGPDDAEEVVESRTLFCFIGASPTRRGSLTSRAMTAGSS